MMRLLPLLLLLVLTIKAYSQDSFKIDTVRQQGYLFVKYDTLHPGTDIPREYYFFPIAKMGENFSGFLADIKADKGEIYLLTPLLFDHENQIDAYNLCFEKFLNITYKFNNGLKDIDEFLKNPKTVIKPDKATYQVIYIDGEWIKMIIPKKYSNLFFENYANSRMLNPELKYYEFNFLSNIFYYSNDLKKFSE